MIRVGIVLFSLFMIHDFSAAAFQTSDEDRGIEMTSREGPFRLFSKRAQTDEGDAEAKNSGESFSVSAIPEGVLFLAAESEIIAEEYKLMYMSPSELMRLGDPHGPRSYRHPFPRGVQQLVQIRAQALCSQVGFDLDPPKNLQTESFSLKYLDDETFPQGKVFTIRLPSDIAPVMSLPRVAWAFSPHGRIKAARENPPSYPLGVDAIFKTDPDFSLVDLMNANRKFLLSAGVQNSRYSPHLVFTQLFCKEVGPRLVLPLID